MFYPKQADIDLLRQSNRQTYVKLELLNKKWQTLDELSGEAMEDNWSINADSDMRRSFSVSLVVKDSTFTIGKDNKVWLDKYIRVSVGLYDLRLQITRWYVIGIFIFNESNYQYNTTQNTLTLTLLDLMAEQNGIRNGVLKGQSTKIPEGNKIRDVLVSTVTQLGGIEKYRIEELQKEIPYDMEFSTGKTVYDVYKEIQNLYPGWELFFDADGMFVFQPIPTCETDPILLDDAAIADLVISEQTANSFSTVRNVTDVWGKCIDADRYCESVTINGAQYNLTLDNFLLSDDGKIPYGTTIAMKANVLNPDNATAKVNNLPAYPIVNENGEALKKGIMLAGKSYVLRYRESKFYFLGPFQIHAISKLFSTVPSKEFVDLDHRTENCDNISYIINADNPFCIDRNNNGEIRQCYSGGEYSKITFDELAKERADYENWKATRLADAMTLELVAIPWLGVNQKIRYTSQLTGKTADYIIKAVNGSMTNGVINVSMIRFYPLYPFIVQPEAA